MYVQEYWGTNFCPGSCVGRGSSGTSALWSTSSLPPYMEDVLSFFVKRNQSVAEFLNPQLDKQTKVRHCHGDIKFGNVIVTPRRIGLLDFENYNVQEWGWEIGDALRSWFSDQLDEVTWSIRANDFEAFLEQQVWFTKKDAVLHTLRTTAKLLVHLYTDREDGRYYFSSESEQDRLRKVDVLISRHETFLPALLGFARERGYL